jgi:hypothetical protein
MSNGKRPTTIAKRTTPLKKENVDENQIKLKRKVSYSAQTSTAESYGRHPCNSGAEYSGLPQFVFNGSFLSQKLLRPKSKEETNILMLYGIA